MKQIPNIEETNTREWEQEFDARFMRDGELLISSDEIDDASDIKTFIHHQLQKARQDWLREEIVWLEGMKKEKEFVEKEWKNEDCSGTTGRWEDYTEHNQALQTIIDRYHSELDQGKKYTMGVDFAKRDHSELDQDVTGK